MATGIITGGSHGLGLELSRALHALGWRLVIDGRHPGPLGAAVEELGPGRVVGIPGDVTDAAHRRALVHAGTDRGDLELLVNNASTIGPSPMPALVSYDLDDWRRVYEVNVVAPLALSQLVLPVMAPGRGRIVNMTSDAAVEGYEGWGGYGSSKAALEQMSRVAAAENDGIFVYWVDPGDMRTQMHQDAFPGVDISDRPLAETSIPGILALVLGQYPSGRYVARDVAAIDR